MYIRPYCLKLSKDSVPAVTANDLAKEKAVTM